MKNPKLNFKKPKNVKVVAAMGAVVLALAVGGYFVGIAPQRSRASSLDAEIAATQQQLVAAQLASPVKPATPRVDDLFRLTKAMPDNAGMPGILLELSRIASETGIDFDSITPGAPVADGAVQSMPIQLLFRGNYYQLSDFLFRLRNLVEKRDERLDVSGRLFSVDGVDFSQSASDSGPAQLEAKLTAKAYIYAPAASAAASASAVAPAPTATTTTPSTTPPATSGGAG